MERIVDALSHPPVFSSIYIGELVSENEWHRPTTKHGAPRIILTPKYRNHLESMAMIFRGSRNTMAQNPDQVHPQWRDYLKYGKFSISTYYVIVLELFMWRMKDTGNQLKAIQDAIEDAEIIDNDRQIVDVVLQRRFHRKTQTDMVLVQLHKIGEDFLPEIKVEQEMGYQFTE